MIQPVRLIPILGLLVLSVGCSAARLAGPAPMEIEPRVGRTVVVIEPFFENTQLRTVTHHDRVDVNNGSMTPASITIAREVREKPVHARPETLAVQYGQVIAEVQRLRPDWRVVSTGTLPVMGDGPVVLIRTVLGESEVVQSNRALKTVAAYASFLLLPLFYAVPPVNETQRVSGLLSIYRTDAVAAKNRLIRYPTQPDYAVDTRGLSPKQQPFGLDVTYEEGVFANERAREPVVLEGLSRQLATAVVALVEGVR